MYFIGLYVIIQYLTFNASLWMLFAKTHYLNYCFMFKIKVRYNAPSGIISSIFTVGD